MRKRITLAVAAGLVSGLLVSTPLTAASPAAAAVVQTGPGRTELVQNIRLVNTQSGLGGSSTPFASGETRTYSIAGVAGLPTSGVKSLALSIGVVSTTSTTEGSIVAFAGSSPRPGITNLRYKAGNAGYVSNTATVAVDDAGQFQVYASHGATDLVIDVQGYTSQSASGALTTITPQRVVDSRNGTGVATGKIAPGGSRDVVLAGRYGIPAGAKGVFVNVIALDASNNGYVKLFPTTTPAGATTPVARYASGAASSNGAFAELGPDGTLRIYNFSGGSAIDVVIDVQGYTSANQPAGEVSTVASRIYDSRPSTLAAGDTAMVKVADVGGIPLAGAGAVLANLTVLSPANTGYLRAWNPELDEPATSALSFNAGVGSSNLSLLPMSGEGYVKVRNRGPSAVTFVLDAQGYASAAPVLSASDQATFRANASALEVPTDLVEQAIYSEPLLAQVPTQVEDSAAVEGGDLDVPLSDYSGTNDPEETVDTVEQGGTTMPASPSDPLAPTMSDGRAADGSCLGTYRLGRTSSSYVARNWIGNKLWTLKFIKRWCYSRTHQKVATTYARTDSSFTTLGGLGWKAGGVDFDPYYKRNKMAHVTKLRQRMKHCVVGYGDICKTWYLTTSLQTNWDGTVIGYPWYMRKAG